MPNLDMAVMNYELGGGLTVGFMKFYLAIDYTWSPKTIN